MNKPQLIEIFVSQDEVHEPKVTAYIDSDGKITPGRLEDIQWLKK